MIDAIRLGLFFHLSRARLAYAPLRHGTLGSRVCAPGASLESEFVDKAISTLVASGISIEQIPSRAFRSPASARRRSGSR